MIVKNMLKNCLEKMGRRDFVDESSTTLEEKQLLTNLLRAINVVYKELVGSYFPLTYEETVAPKRGVIPVSFLSKHILYPIRIEVDGNEVPFVTMPDRIELQEEFASCKIKYAYDPVTALEINDDFACMNASADAVSDGVLSQYYLYLREYDLAKYYDSCYRDKLWVHLNRTRKNMLKPGRWGI